MRLWSLHPCSLDSKGLVAVWREGLLAQKVLTSVTKGYQNHPQLKRFKETDDPGGAIADYLKGVHIEATARGYSFNEDKIRGMSLRSQINVTDGQLNYEFQHLLRKLKIRDPVRGKELEKLRVIGAHPMFKVVNGGTEKWEVV